MNGVVRRMANGSGASRGIERVSHPSFTAIIGTMRFRPVANGLETQHLRPGKGRHRVKLVQEWDN